MKIDLKDIIREASSLERRKLLVWLMRELKVTIEADYETEYNKPTIHLVSGWPDRDWLMSASLKKVLVNAFSWCEEGEFAEDVSRYAKLLREVADLADKKAKWLMEDDGK